MLETAELEQEMSIESAFAEGIISPTLLRLWQKSQKRLGLDWRIDFGISKKLLYSFAVTFLLAASSAMLFIMGVLIKAHTLKIVFGISSAIFTLPFLFALKRTRSNLVAYTRSKLNLHRFISDCRVLHARGFNSMKLVAQALHRGINTHLRMQALEVMYFARSGNLDEARKANARISDTLSTLKPFSLGRPKQFYFDSAEQRQKRLSAA